MGFLKNFFENVFQEDAAQVTSTSSFEHLSTEELEAHLGVKRYGAFTLTEAIRPSYDLKVVPCQGYRHDAYHDQESNTRLPVIMASASHETLFELFVELLEPLGNVVDVVLETSHAREGNGHVDLYREHMDMPVLLSTLWDFEDLLDQRRLHGIGGSESFDPTRDPIRRAQALDRLRRRSVGVREDLEPLRNPLQ